MSSHTLTRRQALGSVGILVVGSPLVEAQGLVNDLQPRLAPLDEIADIDLFEFEDQARLKLSKTAFAAIAGGDREAFDRITFQPSYFVNTMDMDLSLELFGDKQFAPILVGPTASQRDFHPEGELATARGAAAAKATLVVSSRSSVPIEQIAAQGVATLWYQVRAADGAAAVREQTQRALKAGCKVICIQAPASINWDAIGQLRKAITVPVVLEGVTTPDAARTAVKMGMEGVMVSNVGSGAVIDVLPSIADAVGGKAVVLAGGSVRRGSDALKALALGARAVVVGRPAMWGLAPYGAEGVQAVFQMLQSDLARQMGASGMPNLKAIDRTLVRIHGRPPTDTISSGR